MTALELAARAAQMAHREGTAAITYGTVYIEWSRYSETDWTMVVSRLVGVWLFG